MEKLNIDEALPVAELSRLGLYKDGKHLLSSDDITALLAGRRTSLVNLKNLIGEAFTIESLDVKLSLHHSERWGDEIMLHPIYKDITLAKGMTEEELWPILTGEMTNLVKIVNNPETRTDQTLVFEYDGETKEFISYDPLKVIVPFQVNGEKLDIKQRQDFAHGKIVELSDGTKFQYMSSLPKGIVSSRSALILAMSDNRQSPRFLLEGLAPLIVSSVQEQPFSPAFEAAFLEMRKSEGIQAEDRLQIELDDLKNDYHSPLGLGALR
ncbi:hypothetical protein ASU31_00060 [Pedobacter ginsenosidimutans]|uniref:DUF4099 domain-containing protein n=1 Tax=Pedobacter ginsenosidimutans TaxID=687842 RepID=A0A0T5VVE6_9SPHI|nr:DUF4099 domain-containing protein [Pedobacter ginsenosidimutans]KRT17727.1 hypothetical protein ASU31_00060 [Pedobacter ginsenosidimutans]